jgi:hypothetical protein
MQLHNRIDAAILSKNESVISKPYFSSAQNLMNWLIGKNLKHSVKLQFMKRTDIPNYNHFQHSTGTWSKPQKHI